MNPDLHEALAAPPLFDNFVECRTKSQRTLNAISSVKHAVKWALNWKGTRRPKL